MLCFQIGKHYQVSHRTFILLSEYSWTDGFHPPFTTFIFISTKSKQLSQHIRAGDCDNSNIWSKSPTSQASTSSNANDCRKWHPTTTRILPKWKKTACPTFHRQPRALVATRTILTSTNFAKWGRQSTSNGAKCLMITRKLWQHLRKTSQIWNQILTSQGPTMAETSSNMSTQPGEWSQMDRSANIRWVRSPIR